MFESVSIDSNDCFINLENVPICKVDAVDLSLESIENRYELK